MKIIKWQLLRKDNIVIYLHKIMFYLTDSINIR